jgi:hypothetical protein
VGETPGAEGAQPDLQALRETLTRAKVVIDDTVSRLEGGPGAGPEILEALRRAEGNNTGCNNTSCATAEPLPEA